MCLQSSYGSKPKYIVVMFYALEPTRKYNQFQDVKIPSARALYNRYGAQQGTGVFVSSDEIGTPVNFGNNVIDDVVRSDKILNDAYSDSINFGV